MSGQDREKWDSRYRTTADTLNEPAFVLREYAHLLPLHGEALDLAAGLGANAQFLAWRGLNCAAWDISRVAMEKLAIQASEQELSLRCSVRDVVAQPPSPQSFDVIVVSRFLERRICADLRAALRPGGLLFYQTFIQDKADATVGPSNPDYLLGTNELLRLFPDLTVRAYREDGTVGDPSCGLRNEAFLVAMKDRD